jgi:hypothetical protein
MRHRKLTGKPLLVVGDPNKGMSCGLYGSAYGMGDVCIDLYPITEGVIKADIYDYLRTLADNSAIIFISCVLEYIPTNLDPIIKEIYRVAGNSKNIFIVYIPWYYYITRYGYNFQNDRQHNLILCAPPYSDTIEWRRN